MLALIPLLLSVAPQPKAPTVATPVPRTVITACGAIPQADVEREIGRRLGKGVDSDGATTCDYAGTNGIVSIRLQRLSRDLDIDSELAALRDALPDARLTPLADVGSRAILLALPNAGAQVHAIRQGRVYVMVSVLGFGEAADVARAATALARRLLDVI